MKRVVPYISLIIFFLLPILYSIGITYFIFGLVISIGVIFLSPTNLEGYLSRTFYWSFSFFGVSIYGMKIFDFVLLIGIVLILIKNKKIYFNNNILLLLPFFLYIVFFWFVFELFQIRNTNYDDLGSTLELFRYVLAFIAVVLFSQLKTNYLGMKKWIDTFAIGVIMQAIVMLRTVGVQSYQSQSQSSILSVDLFSIDPLNPNSEVRISGFFSDPNKMMAFFSILLLIRVAYILLNNKNGNIWKYGSFIYILGILISLSRTGVIIAGAYTLVFLIGRIFKNNLKVDMIFIGVSVVSGIIVLLFKEMLITKVNSIFVEILSFFGRSRTAEIDSNVTSDTRVLIWKQAINYISQRPIFGNGLLSESYLLPIPTHNTLMQQLLDSGIIGTFLYFFSTFTLLMRQFGISLVLILVGIPMIFLDLGNFRIIFVLIGISLQIPRGKQ